MPAGVRAKLWVEKAATDAIAIKAEAAIKTMARNDMINPPCGCCARSDAMHAPVLSLTSAMTIVQPSRSVQCGRCSVFAALLPKAAEIV